VSVGDAGSRSWRCEVRDEIFFLLYSLNYCDLCLGNCKVAAGVHSQHLPRLSELYARIEHTGEQTAEGRGRRLTRPAAPLRSLLDTSEGYPTEPNRAKREMNDLGFAFSISLTNFTSTETPLIGCSKAELRSMDMLYFWGLSI